MFDKLHREIDALDAKRERLTADWDQNGNNALLAFYVRIVPRILNAERCNIFINDPETRFIWLRAGTGIDPGGTQFEDRDNESIIREIIKTGEYKLENGIEKADGLHGRIDNKTGLVTRDILAVPIRSLDGTEVAGVVEVINKSGGGGFTAADRDLLDELAHYLETAIESIYFDMEATSLLHRTSRVLTVAASAALWVVGLGILAIIGRVLWVGLKSTAG